MATTRIMPLHAGKGRTVGRAIRYCQELCAKSVCRLRLNEVSQQ